MAQHVTVSAPCAQWPTQYAREREAIAAILGDNAIALYHIGSTAVPGLAAKPIIDIMAAVRSLSAVDEAAQAFARIGYASLGEFGIAGRRYLRKGGDERTHQLHIFQADDWGNIGRHLAFRDYMRAHGEERAAYAALKIALAERFPEDIEAYCDGKAAFVRERERRALAWFDGTWDRLYIAARKVQRARTLSPTMEAGAVSAALLTRAGNIYVGVCIDTACSLGMCAERSAIANMITNGEHEIARLVAVMPDGRVGMPCGACREMMMQLGSGAGDALILRDVENKRAVKLRELVPDWWREEEDKA